jgi:hypothetical protein
VTGICVRKVHIVARRCVLHASHARAGFWSSRKAAAELREPLSARANPHLTHETHVVADCAMLEGLTVTADPDEVALFPLDLAVSGCQPHQLTFMRSFHRPYADHRVAVPGNVLDREMSVRKGVPQALHQLGLPLGPRRGSRQRSVVDVFVSEQMLEPCEVAVVECCPEAMHQIEITVAHRANLLSRALLLLAEGVA